MAKAIREWCRRWNPQLRKYEYVDCYNGRLNVTTPPPCCTRTNVLLTNGLLAPPCCVTCEVIQQLMGCIGNLNTLMNIYPADTLVSPDVVFIADLLQQLGCRYQLPLTPDGFGGFIVNSIYDAARDIYLDCFGSIEVTNANIPVYDGTNSFFPQTIVYQCLRFGGGDETCPDFGICWEVRSEPFNGDTVLVFDSIKSCTDPEMVNQFQGWLKCRQCVDNYYPCKPEPINFEIISASSSPILGGTRWTINFAMEIYYPPCCEDTGDVILSILHTTPNANTLGAVPQNVNITYSGIVGPITGTITYDTIALQISPTIFEIRVITEYCLSDSVNFTFPQP